ncbi:arabinosyltransferase domain-containing protein [Corynebacterium stationis]|uniref:arabinosyltransferase domain-containing protein n=1 Tax=Corynebacterium stationis TaxID=1705 RepID=UPI00099CBC79|nr:arabinosyltransferase domain-containing protein [Corynebacterium stationis]AQX70078.1 arabinosyltransferase [Corynebacterium stationis]AQX72304.1 arabinosyltransferase [Corynebacterium stationis]
MNDVYTAELPELNARPAPKGLRLAAIITGLLGFVLFLATPFLPVTQTQSSFDWPANDSLNSVTAPLISVSPEEIDAAIPVAAIDMLREGQDMLYGTVPPESEEASNRGMFVRAGEDGLSVISLDEVVLSLSAEQVSQLNDDDVLTINAVEDGTTVSVGDFTEESEDDLRPQVVGVFTEIEDTPENLAQLSDAGLNVHVEINSRFTSSPSAIKLVAMIGGAIMMLAALVCIARMDRLDGKKISFMPATWKQVRPLDGVVSAILVFWHIFGANTSDDGFILTMGRVKEHSTYMANYYRWYGVPEAPFGTPYYDLVAFLSNISATSVFMRIPTLIAAILTWFILSREILPRFGPVINDRRVAHWTAAFMFLAFWLPYNNGIRPEPIVAFGVVFTWASFERSIATSRMLPAAIGTIAATLTLTAGPTGLFAVGVFLVSLPALFSIFSRRKESVGGWLPLVASFLAVGTSVIALVFSDQTLATVLESTRVRSAVGPSLNWYDEYVRYTTLFEGSVDGSLTRRFAMFTMLFSLALIIYAFIRDKKVLGTPKGPTQRLLIIMALSMFFLMFTPTKWTHHFGIYAGIAGVIAALGAVVLSQIAMRSTRARTFAVASVVMLMAISLAGWNAWWYVSSFGIPWWDRSVQFMAVEASTVVMVIGLLIIAIGIVQALRHNYRKNHGIEQPQVSTKRWANILSAPLAIACIAIVAFSCLSFAKGYISQSPNYSVGQGNLKALGGNVCQMADSALIETNTNDSFLTPVTGELDDSLINPDEENRGFDPNFIPEDIEPENLNSASVGAIGSNQSGSSPSNSEQASSGSDPSLGGQSDNSESSSNAQSTAENATDTSSGGIRGTDGVNGSTMHLPFNLDYTKVPVLGSYNSAQRGTSEVTTQWYNLPEQAGENTPVLAVSAAGDIYHHDVNDIEQEGMELALEYGTLSEGNEVTNTGELELRDVGAAPKWRNLRIALDEIPEEANVVRLVAVDDSTDEDSWLAFTPPRVPELTSLNSQFDSSIPGLLDWSTAFQFPCQRTFDHFAGVTEIPEYRILPDAPAQTSLTDFQSFSGGGAMATAEAVNYSYEIPSYLDGDWARDWGAIQKYELRTNSTGITPDPADINYEEITRTGWWQNSEMKIRKEGED